MQSIFASQESRFTIQLCSTIFRSGSGHSLFLQAVCIEEYFLANRGFGPSCRGPVVVPLVCDYLWASVVNSYPRPRLKIIVDKRPKLQIYTSRCQDCESCSESFELFWQPLSPVRVPRDTAINASQLSSITLIYTWQKNYGLA